MIKKLKPQLPAILFFNIARHRRSRFRNARLCDFIAFTNYRFYKSEWSDQRFCRKKLTAGINKSCPINTAVSFPE